MTPAFAGGSKARRVWKKGAWVRNRRRADALKTGDVVMIPRFGKLIVRGVTRQGKLTWFEGYPSPEGGPAVSFELDNAVTVVFYGNANPDPLGIWVVRER